MFWGVTLENGKKYQSVVDQTYHVSMAAIEPSDVSEPVSVYVKTSAVNGEYLVCSLDGVNTRQVPLDLLFVEGLEVCFYIKGANGRVHLTGYLAPEDDYTDFDEEDEEEEDDVSEEELSPAKLPAGQKRASAQAVGVPVKKAKTQGSPALKTNGKPTANGKPVKAQSEEDDDDSESDEEDLSDDHELEKMLAGLTKAKNASPGSGDMSVDDEDDDDDDEDDDDEDDDEEDDEEEAKLMDVKKKMKEDLKKPQEKPQQQQGQKPQANQQKQQQKPQQRQQGGYQGGNQGTPRNFNQNNKGKGPSPYGQNRNTPQGGRSPGFNRQGGGNTPFNKGGNKARNQFGSGQKFSGKKH